MRTKRKKYSSVSNAEKINAAASHHTCYDENGETPLRAALDVRQPQAIAAGGIAAAKAIRNRSVKQQDESNARTSNAN